MTLVYKPHEYSQQRQKEKKVWVYPVHMAMEAQYYKERGYGVMWDEEAVEGDTIVTEPQGIPFNRLPMPDRVWTKAFDKKYQRYGNYKFKPATHMMAANGCWWGKCKFCVENKKPYDVRSPQAVIEELIECERLGFHEVFDDSATFPIGDWLINFADLYQRYKLLVTMGCNMRISRSVDFNLLAQCNMRMVLFGVESFNQETLNQINKGTLVKDIIPCIKRANLAGLEPHVAIMVGYPWESIEDEMRTIKKVKELLIDGIAKTAQVSVYDIPGKPKIDRGTKDKIFDVAYNPKFWINKLKDIKKLEDWAYLMRSIKKGVCRD